MTPQTQAQAATALVERARRGDRSAFDELVRRYRQRVLALALHLSGNESEAEDITQEVFLKAYQKISEFEGRSHFFTWVYRITVNRALNARRDRDRRRELPIHDDPRVERAVAVDARGNPAKAAALRQTYARLLQALDALPGEMKTSVVLVVLQGLSHGEAAVVQDCSPGTVAWRIHEARRRLRRAMAKETPVARTASGQARPLSRDLRLLLRDWSQPLPRPIH